MEMKPDPNAVPRPLEEEYPELGRTLMAIAQKTHPTIRGLDIKMGKPTTVLLTNGKIVKVGKMTERNWPCPCGSGKKFKKCCLNRQ